MSLSEIIDKGEDHPYANLKVNSVDFNDNNSVKWNDYEVITLDVDFVNSGTGPWPSTQTRSVKFVRAGNKVTMYIPDVFATGNGLAGFIIMNIPSQFLPANQGARTTEIRRVRNAGSPTTGIAVINLPSIPDTISFYKDISEAEFDGTGLNVGIYGTDITFSLTT